MSAFKLALRQGADGIEFDVHLSADGVPVVIHDARLERTTSGAGRVGAHTSAKLRRLDAGSWFNRRYPARAQARYEGLKIPLLSEVLAWVRAQGCRAYIEIKEGVGVYPGIDEKVRAEIVRARVERLATVISFDLRTLRHWREIDSRIPLGLDVVRPLLALRRAKSLAATSLLAYWRFASRRLIRRAHRAGLQVLVWDADRPGQFRRALADGVDGIVTSYPGRLEVIRARPRSAGENAGRSDASGGTG